MRLIDAKRLLREIEIDKHGNIQTTINGLMIAMGRSEVEAEPVKHGRWIPVSERLPEEDTEVLISYHYKEGEGDTSHVDIDITTYGQMYFGGNKVGNNKHWRAPFEYFHSNYEVIAWMPLPVPYKGEGEAYETD